MKAYCPTCEKRHNCWVKENGRYACLFCDALIWYCENGIGYEEGQRWQPSPWWFLSFQWLKGLYAQIVGRSYV